MKKRSSNKPAPLVDLDEILPSYNFRRASPNKYASRYAAGSAVIVLDPDVAAAFPNSRKANAARRALIALRKRNHKRPASRSQP